MLQQEQAHAHESDWSSVCPACSISVTFVSEKDGSETTVKAPIGKHLLEVAHDNDIELEGAHKQQQQDTQQNQDTCSHARAAAAPGHVARGLCLQPGYTAYLCSSFVCSRSLLDL